MESTQKKVFYIRHGESTYNQWRKSAIHHFMYNYPNEPQNRDVLLTSLGNHYHIFTRIGEQQCKELASQIQQSNFFEEYSNDYVLFVSPLRRAIQTALQVFPNINKQKITIEQLIREKMGTACDIGSNPQKLTEQFPDLDFSQIPEYFWLNHLKESERNSLIKKGGTQIYREKSESVKKRVLEFLTKIQSRPEKLIIIVSHGQVFQELRKILNLPSSFFQIKNCSLTEIPWEKIKNLS